MFYTPSKGCFWPQTCSLSSSIRQECLVVNFNVDFLQITMNNLQPFFIFFLYWVKKFKNMLLSIEFLCQQPSSLGSFLSLSTFMRPSKGATLDSCLSDDPSKLKSVKRPSHLSFLPGRSQRNCLIKKGKFRWLFKQPFFFT